MVKPTAREEKDLRERIFKDLLGGHRVTDDDQLHANTVGDIITDMDVMKTYSQTGFRVTKPLARGALQRLANGRDVSPAVLEQVKAGQYRVVRIPQRDPSKTGSDAGEAPFPPQATPMPSGNRSTSDLRASDQLTVVENMFGEDLGKDVYILRLEETGDYFVARVKTIDIPEV